MQCIVKYCSLVGVFVFILALVGCGASETMQQSAPEMGDIEKYLLENPEVVDQTNSAGSQDVDETASNEY